jgi:hypothetical protein
VQVVAVKKDQNQYQDGVDDNAGPPTGAGRTGGTLAQVRPQAGQNHDVEKQRQQRAPCGLPPGEVRQQECEDQHGHVYDLARGE